MQSQRAGTRVIMENMDQVEISDYELDQLQQLVRIFNSIQQGTSLKQASSS